MYELGLIGYGSMASALLNGFLEAGVMAQDQVAVSTRGKSRLKGLTGRWPGVTVAENNLDVTRNSKIVLIGVKPRDMKLLLDEIVPGLRDDAHLVSIVSGVAIANLGQMFSGKATKVIPSITAEVRQGTSLVCHNSHVTPEDAAKIETLFGAVGRVQLVSERNFEAAADLTSCGPGLISAIIDEFASAGMRHSTLTRAECEAMAISALYGTSKLLFERGMSPGDVITRVATKGGITEEGVKVLRKELPATFDEVFAATLSKHDIVKAAIRQQFSDPDQK